MENGVRAKDTYRIECSDYMSPDLIASLFMLYQPLLTRDGALLYMTMYSEGSFQKTQESHNRILNLTGMTIDEFEKARIRLEEYLLCKTFVQQQESRNTYIYQLNPPLSVRGFLSQKELMSILTAAVGEKTVEQTLSKLSAGAISTNDYKEITRAISHVRKARDYDLSTDYSKPKPRYNFSDSDATINFNYDRFITITDTLVFPAELRTQENMRLIGQLATVYGLSAERMTILVNKAVNPQKVTFDAERLKVLAARSTPDVTKAKDIYALPPVSFLQAKQNGAPVTMSDRKILENLSTQMKFPPDVINIMIEYILKISQNRLIKNFVDMVAGEWARDGVTTRAQAFAETKKVVTANKASSKKTKDMPEYFTKDDGKPSESGELPTEDELKQVQELMKQMGGR